MTKAFLQGLDDRRLNSPQVVIVPKKRLPQHSSWCHSDHTRGVSTVWVKATRPFSSRDPRPATRAMMELLRATRVAAALRKGTREESRKRRAKREQTRNKKRRRSRDRQAMSGPTKLASVRVPGQQSRQEKRRQDNKITQHQAQSTCSQRLVLTMNTCSIIAWKKGREKGSTQRKQGKRSNGTKGRKQRKKTQQSREKEIQTPYR